MIFFYVTDIAKNSYQWRTPDAVRTEKTVTECYLPYFYYEPII